MLFNMDFAKEQARIYLTTVFLDHLRKENPLFNGVTHIVIEKASWNSGSEYLQYNNLLRELNLFFVCANSEKMEQLGQFLQDTLDVEVLTTYALDQYPRDEHIKSLLRESIVGLRNADISKLLAHFPTLEFGETYEQLLTNILPDIYPLYLQFFNELQNLTRYLDATAQHVGKTLPVDTGVIFQDSILSYAGLQVEQGARSYRNYGSDFDLKTGRYIARYKLHHPEDLERVREAVNHCWQAEDQIINIETGEIRFFINLSLIITRLPDLKKICAQGLIETTEIEKREQVSRSESRAYSELNFFYRSSLMTTKDFIDMINIKTINDDLIKNLSQRPRSCAEYFRILTKHFLGPKYTESYRSSSHIECLSESKESTDFMKQITASQKVDVGDYLCCFLPPVADEPELLADINNFIENLRAFAKDHKLEQDAIFLASESPIIMQEFGWGCFGPETREVPYYIVVIKAPCYLLILNYLLPEAVRNNAVMWLDIFKRSSPENKNPKHLLKAIEENYFNRDRALQTIYETAFPVPESAPLPGLTLSTP